MYICIYIYTCTYTYMNISKINWEVSSISTRYNFLHIRGVIHSQWSMVWLLGGKELNLPSTHFWKMYYLFICMYVCMCICVYWYMCKCLNPGSWLASSDLVSSNQHTSYFIPLRLCLWWPRHIRGCDLSCYHSYLHSSELTSSVGVFPDPCSSFCHLITTMYLNDTCFVYLFLVVSPS